MVSAAKLGGEPSVVITNIFMPISKQIILKTNRESKRRKTEKVRAMGGHGIVLTDVDAKLFFSE